VRLGVADVDGEEHSGTIIVCPMALRLYAVPASHPSAAVEEALRLKGLPYRRIDLPNGLHVVPQLARFGRRTVPGLAGDGVRAVGSRPIMRVLDALAPEPPLLPRDPAERARVEEAERWGEEVLQPGARRLAWTIIPRAPEAAASYVEGAWFAVPPPFDVPLLKSVVPLERRINGVTEARSREDLRALPGWMDRADALVADGTIGTDPANAADLQIASSVALLLTYDDLRRVVDGRPAAELARRRFPDFPGHVPAGAVPAEWLS
jgi:glutathione S-transferase